MYCLEKLTNWISVVKNATFTWIYLTDENVFKFCKLWVYTYMFLFIYFSIYLIYMFYFLNPLDSWAWVQIENLIEMESIKGNPSKELRKKIITEKKNRNGNFPKRELAYIFKN